jgi:hypothetical protein
MEKATVTINNGPFKATVPRTELVDVSPTHDGVAFNFKGGVQLYYTNNFMEQTTKQIMQSTADSFPGKNLVFDLTNPQRPVFVDAT